MQFLSQNEKSRPPNTGDLPGSIFSKNGNLVLETKFEKFQIFEKFTQ